jgi:hypothetical protein
MSSYFATQQFLNIDSVFPHFRFDTVLNSDELVRWHGKMAMVYRHERGSIILPSVSRLPSILIVGGQVAYFLGDAKSRSPSGLSEKTIKKFHLSYQGTPKPRQPQYIKH